MKPKFIVYGLIDPRDGKVFYVGKSCNGDKAMKRHVQPNSIALSDTPKNRRIVEILEAGLEISYTIIHRARNKRDVEIKERLTIFSMSRELDLCNVKMNKQSSQR